MLVRLQALLLIICCTGSLWLAAFMVSIPITLVTQPTTATASNAPATIPTPTTNQPRAVIVTDYATFADNALAGFMQVVTIPEPAGMRLDDYGYLWTDHTMPVVPNHFHTYAVGALYPEDARTNMGCYEVWRYDKPPTTSPDYGQAFCISDNDMLWFFNHGAYSMSYDGY